MTRRPLKRVALVIGLFTLLITPACGGGGGSIQGTYESGMVRLTLHAAGKATFRLGETDFDCTYEEHDKGITLKCPARDPANIIFNNDGSLVDPFVGKMTKVK